jgi:arsenate reductase
MMDSGLIRLQVLYFDGCPHARAALELATAVAEEGGPRIQVEALVVDTPERAAAERFLGSPSLRVNGRDVEGRRDPGGTLCCRTYEGGAGVPPKWLVETAVLKALEPQGVLFLCVANSARSQLAEGIARQLAPSSVTVWSAGSAPTRVRPEAITVLAEIDIDSSGNRSKHVDEIPAAEVDTVITLCAEEECPLFLGQAIRLHWGLPDPAAVTGSAEERLEAFRQVRDELRRRLTELFG